MTNALLVIDVQESFCQRASWRLASNPDIVAKVNALVAKARSDNDLVVWVLHTEPGTGTVFDPANGHVRLMRGLVPREGEPVLHKTAHNAFTTTNLQRLLTARGIRELTVSGIRTEQCCETTARIASDLGFDVTFVTDATATEPLRHWTAPADMTPEQLLADPRTLSVEDVITRTEYALAGRFATIRTVAELTGAEH
ncbi:cysteine hydrolase family protein [Goodfellowiella coeruleoviolacea]|uniref:Nicotinamidase-related amidase n=1 Tax=Goodfellowiella coeruleoviolacea TaxID=334858 RepID=A0AAE3GBB7_9PSEU|nr:isochorismatase family protein [Goodfellowiella coeruleoviolacea]MCP2165106.1 Nicotinamidase-related amidase [Goodfellowiella coeruleoviolacea]